MSFIPIPIISEDSESYAYILFPDQTHRYITVVDDNVPIIEITNVSGTARIQNDPTYYNNYYFTDATIYPRGDSGNINIKLDTSTGTKNPIIRDAYANIGVFKLADRYYDQSTGTYDFIPYKTSYIFNERNKDQISITVSMKYAEVSLYSTSPPPRRDFWYDTGYMYDPVTLDTPVSITLTLNAPPTFEVENISTGPYYKDLTEYMVNISESEAKYGGDILNRSITINNNIASVDSDGSLSLFITEVGTFSPEVKVTDSRGQTTIKTLPSIEVLDYSHPEILNCDVIRCDSTGIQDDEGTYALITVQYKYDKTAAESLVKPIVKKDILDNISNYTTWYESYNPTTGINDEITFPYVSSDNGIMYGLVDYDFDRFTSYEIWTNIVDSLSGESETYKDILSLAYYTVDFLAGGYGIAFGKASEAEGFECNMNSAFSKDVNLVINPGLSETDYNLDNVIRRLDWDKDLYPELYIDEADPFILEMSQSQHGGSHQISIVFNEFVDENNLIWEVTGQNRAARIENGLLTVEGNEASEAIVHVTVKYNFGGHMLQDSIDVLPQWRLP